jgi:hypothetical protein
MKKLVRKKKKGNIKNYLLWGQTTAERRLALVGCGVVNGVVDGGG